MANAGPADASPSDHGAPVNIPVFRFLAPAMVAHSTPDTPVAATPSADASLQNQPITVIPVPGVANLANAEGAASASNDATATADLPAIAQSTTGSLAAVTRPFSALSEDSLIPPAPLNLPDPTPTTPADTKVDPVASDQAEESLSSDPMGADLIAELTPLDSSSLEATLAGLIARFDGLETAIPQANADGQVRLVPVALGVAAFEVARRWWNNRSETAARRTWKSRSTLLRGFF